MGSSMSRLVPLRLLSHANWALGNFQVKLAVHIVLVLPYLLPRWSIVSSKLRETDEGTCIRYLPADLQGCRSWENLKIWDHYDINKNNTSNNTQRCASFRTTDRLLIPGRLISANTTIWAHTTKVISYDWRQNERRRNRPLW